MRQSHFKIAHIDEYISAGNVRSWYRAEQCVLHSVSYERGEDIPTHRGAGIFLKERFFLAVVYKKNQSVRLKKNFNAFFPLSVKATSL